MILLLAVLWAAPPATPRAAARACLESSREAAVLACREALARSPSPASAATLHRLLAAELGALERWEEAVESYRAWGRLRPDDAEPRVLLGGALLFGLDRPSEAAAVFQEAIALDPAVAAAHGGLGDALAVLGRHPEAVAAYAEAERREPAYFETRPASRERYARSRTGEAWP
ncbi:MAG TPA: tetratricopeptide repeat protein [Vicinamibacteria bacterium]